MLFGEGSQASPYPGQWIIKKSPATRSFLGDDSIVSDADVLRTDFGRAFCNVAVADAEDVFEFLRVVEGIQWMHRQKRDADEETRTSKIHDLLITHHTTDILAEDELDTFVEFLNEFYVLISASGKYCLGLKGLWF